MDEYISREAVKAFPIRRDHYDKKNGNIHFINGIETVMDYVDSLPAADVVPVKRGRWGNYDTLLDGYRCSCCKCSHRSCTTYCPNCGARMKGVD